MDNKIRSLRPPRKSLAMLTVAVALALPAVALASDQFNDVLSENPFHDDISAIADAGITSGFGDGGYHPTANVTRQAMAAFLHRGFGRIALSSGNTLLTASVDVAQGDSSSVGYVPVRSVTIDVPGATNEFSPNQFVHVLGRVAFFDSMSNSVDGCPCEFIAFIRDTTSNTISAGQFQTFESSSTGFFQRNFMVEAVFTAPSGPRTYRLEVGLSFRPGTTNAASFEFDLTSSVSATTFPFGSSGSDTL
ncbi:MAG: S-layer homology domain-containing protein [Candidatus Limnocylindrales bacterium]